MFENYMLKVASCLQLKSNSILVEPDIPIYDLRQVLQQVGLPLEPQAPLFEQLKVCSDHLRCSPTTLACMLRSYSYCCGLLLACAQYSVCL